MPNIHSTTAFLKTHFQKSLIFSLLLFPILAQATHIIGGEMTYEYLGDVAPNMKKYKFTLSVYRDCYNGNPNAPLDNPARIAIYKGNALGGLRVASFGADLMSEENIDPIIPPCADKNNVPPSCVERGFYSFEYTLPVSLDSSYYIVYQRCCRTNAIINITSPESRGGTYMVELTPASMAANNSSPTYKNFPPTFICGQFPLEFDHSATDADGDQLVYEFCNPLHGGGQGGGGGGGGGNCNSPTPNPPCGPPFQTVTYFNNFTFSDPMGGSPRVKIDPTTGEITGVPVGTGQYVLGICCKEYRNGVLLGMISRDIQFNVVDCAPAVVADVLETELLAPQTFLIKSCGAKNVVIVNQSPQTPSLLTQEWEFDMKNGNIFKSPSFNAIIPFPDYGEYFGTLYLNRGLQCEDTAFLVVRVFPPLEAGFAFEYDVCTENPVLFTDTSLVGAAGGLVSRNWDFGVSGATATEPNPEFQLPAYGNYPVQLKLKDVNDCESTVSHTVVWEPKLIPEIPPLGDRLVCLPDEFSPDLFSDSLDVENDFTWDFFDGSPTADGANPTHKFTKVGDYEVSVFIKNDYGCDDTDTMRVVRVRDRPSPDFSYLPTMPTNIDNKVQFFNRSDSTGIYWLWDFGGLDGSREQNPRFTFPDTGQVRVNLLVSNAWGCGDSLARVLDVVPTVKLFIPNAFHPSGTSGLGNEIFKPLGLIPAFSNFKMEVFGRWGELLFLSTDPEFGWDGRRAGSSRRMPSGAYFYRISMLGPRGEPLNFQGSVSLLD